MLSCAPCPPSFTPHLEWSLENMSNEPHVTSWLKTLEYHLTMPIINCNLLSWLKKLASSGPSLPLTLLILGCLWLGYDLPSPPETCQAHPQHKAFSLTVPSFWNRLYLVFTWLAEFVIASQFVISSLNACPFLGESHPTPLSYIPVFSFSAQHFCIWYIFLFFFLICFSPPLSLSSEHKLWAFGAFYHILLSAKNSVNTSWIDEWINFVEN